MPLRDLSLKTSYRSGRDALLDDFYLPCFREAVLYDRAVGFFSSSLYQVIALAFADFVSRDGMMRLVCSPRLTEEDFMAMKNGVERRAQQTLREDFEALLAHTETLPAARLLATLIAHEVIAVRLAFPEEPGGMFHDKTGIFEDVEGKRISFVGSANETWQAWGRNHESFEVFCSWQNEQDLLRTRNHHDEFERLWRGRDPGVQTVDIERVTFDRIMTVAEDDLEKCIQTLRDGQLVKRSESPRRELMDHQVRVLANWEAQEHKGIVAFATGAGKTLTAIEGIRRWGRTGNPAVVMVPGRELHEQWIREFRAEIPAARILPAGAGSGREWQDLLPLWTAPGSVGEDPRIVVVTNQTFASDAFSHRMRNGRHVLVVADEMHRAGSLKTLAALEQVSCGATLGLSATYRREFDPAGTSRLLAFFGPVLQPTVSLADALTLGLLVPYDYRMTEATLAQDEAVEYEALTERVRKLVAQGESPDTSDRLQMLLIRRARILKGARAKVPSALEILQSDYCDGDRWLVYCDDVSQLRALVNGCLAAGLPAMEFHSGMRGDRRATLSSLAQRGGVVVAIRCLDEGVDIPVTDHALILASSTVEREYIQRRGRVLRRATGKLSAEIHDLILVDENGGALTKGEAVRALEFANLARNRTARLRLETMVALSKDPINLPDWLDDAPEEDAE
jgi:superfamily II DNA or RNA helicase